MSIKYINAMKPVRQKYNEGDDDELNRSLGKRKHINDSEYNDDDISNMSFDSLNQAQKKLQLRQESESESESDSDNSDEDSGSIQRPQKKGFQRDNNSKTQKKKNKHAPAETSSKKPVSKIRSIEGLNPKYSGTSLHQDPRFDAALGKADIHETRKNYAFLDEYRQNEINDLKKLMNDKKAFNKLSFHEKQETEHRLQSLKSRLDTLKNRDLQHKILDDYKKDQFQKFKSGKQSSPYFLKRSEQRKLLQKAKFESMKPSQVEKVMERKRKRKLGKEFKELEFRK